MNAKKASLSPSGNKGGEMDVATAAEHCCPRARCRRALIFDLAAAGFHQPLRVRVDLATCHVYD